MDEFLPPLHDGIVRKKMFLFWDKQTFGSAKPYGSTRSIVRRIASNLPLGPCPRVHFQVRDGIFLNYSALRKTSQYDRQRWEFYQVELCMRFGKRPFCRMESIFPGSMKRSCDSCLCVNLLTSQLLSRSIDMDLRDRCPSPKHKQSLRSETERLF